MQWQENRIETNNTVEDVSQKSKVENILLSLISLFQGAWSPVSLEFLKDLWIPNVFIYNLKSFHSIEVLKRLAGELKRTSVMFIDPSGPQNFQQQKSQINLHSNTAYM